MSITTKTLILYGYKCEACGANVEPNNDERDYYNFCQYCGTKLSDDIQSHKTDNG